MSYDKVIIDQYPNTVAEVAEIDDQYKELATEISKSAVDELLNKLTKIPRVCGHPEEISQYLFDWAKEHGLDPKRDSEYNIYWDIEATPGCEDWPKVMLQIHSDIVWETTDSTLSKNDGIDAVFEEDTGKMHSRDYKTTLGADPGQGMATIMELSINKEYKHGPLRALFTFDEEQTMAGSLALGKEVIDCDYCLNVDGRQVGVVRVSCSGVYGPFIEKNVEMIKPSFDTQIEISISNLLGGHSGNSIILKRISAVDFMHKMLKKLIDENVKYELVSLVGGTSVNSIPLTGTLKIVVDNSDVEKVKDVARNVLNYLSDLSLDDKNGKLDFNVSDNPSDVFKQENLDEIIYTFDENPYKIFEMNELLDNVPKNSHNFGIVKIADGKIEFCTKYRFTNQEFLDETSKRIDKLIEDLNYKATYWQNFPAWPTLENNKVLDAYVEAYRKTINIDPIVTGTHGSLEIGCFARHNPNFQCISIGGDIEEEHSVKETFYTKSFPQHIAVLINFLENFH